jgi:hypothetical protein
MYQAIGFYCFSCGANKIGTFYSFQNNKIEGFIDFDRLFSATAPSETRRGFTGYGTATYGYADFDNWLVGPPSWIR